MSMSTFDYEKRKFEDEVEAEAARLVRQGTPPYDAIDQARRMVTARRRQAAGLDPNISDKDWLHR
jgi:hypothetical protein